MPKPLILMILDGWGIRSNPEDNAIARGKTPVMDRLRSEYPCTELNASGLAVGLPDGQMGNSEVGHLNIGAGRVVYQDLTRISKAIAEGSFFTNPVLLECMGKTRAAGGRLHLAGLLSDGGVHSHNTHLYALLALAKKEGINEVFVHCFLDGRDTPPRSAADYLSELEAEMARIGAGRIASVMGRYFAMDRDNRWERVQKAYDAMVLGEGQGFASAREAIDASYGSDVGDEFVVPAAIRDENGPIGTLRDGDGFIFFNFRADRARELTRALTVQDFSGFARRLHPKLASFVCMTEYDETFGLPLAFCPEELTNILGGVVAAAGMRQLRIAETEKYAHVTFFFNGGSEVPFPREDRVLVPSPKDVPTYDLKPEMSAYQVAEQVLGKIDDDVYDLIIINFANADMVGHTGVLDAATRAIEAVDTCVGKVVEKALSKCGAVLVTADHGNAEMMKDENGRPHTAHTCNPVPFILVDGARKSARLRSGILADIAPTVLHLLAIPQPREMTGRSLIEVQA
jgi:2,3-bisphosphoglycerate-independent phosphoglycerate mutase